MEFRENDVKSIIELNLRKFLKEKDLTSLNALMIVCQALALQGLILQDLKWNGILPEKFLQLNSKDNCNTLLQMAYDIAGHSVIIKDTMQPVYKA